MIRIIDGKRYNTQTAHKVVEIATPYFANDWKYEDSALYRTTKGSWFLAGNGGPMSRWAQRAEGGGWCSGSGILPIGEVEARTILEDQNALIELEKYFASSIEEA